SNLGEAGGLGPFPNQTILAYNVSKQGRGFVPANGAEPANVNLTAQGAQTARSTTVANNNPPSQSSAQATQTVPSTAVANNNPPSQSSAQAAQTVPSTAVANNNPPPRPKPPPPAQPPRPSRPVRRRKRPAMDLVETAGTIRISGISRIGATAGTPRDE